MPKITWGDLSIIKHDISNSFDALCSLERYTRDLYRGAPPVPVADDIIKQIGSLKGKTVKSLEFVTDLIEGSEDE